MGIETIIAIAAIAASAAGTGAEIKASRDQASDAKDAQHKQEAAVRAQNQKLADTQAAQDATMQARSARMRQKALLAGQGNADTIGTSPLGLAGGAAGDATGAQGLKTTLGA